MVWNPAAMVESGMSPGCYLNGADVAQFWNNARDALFVRQRDLHDEERACGEDEAHVDERDRDRWEREGPVGRHWPDQRQK